jgi:hypothetical protein
MDERLSFTESERRAEARIVAVKYVMEKHKDEFESELKKELDKKGGVK